MPETPPRNRRSRKASTEDAEIRRRNAKAWHTARDTPLNELVDHLLRRAADTLAQRGGPWTRATDRDGNETISAETRKWRIAIVPAGSESHGTITVERIGTGKRPVLLRTGDGRIQAYEVLAENQHEDMGAAQAGRLLYDGLFETLFPGDPGGLSSLARVTETLPLHPGQVTLVSTGHEGKFNRVPAVADLATLAPVEAIEVDGEPIASGAPLPVRILRPRRPKTHEQGHLFHRVRRIGAYDVADATIAATAAWQVENFRSPIVSDVHKIAAFAFAASRGCIISQRDGAIFVGGTDTAANRNRWNNACSAGDALRIITDPKTGRWLKLMVAEMRTDGTIVVSAPAWWDGRCRHRLSGTLWRPHLLKSLQHRGAGGADLFATGLERTIAGFEALLSYGPTPGRGRGARTPNTLIAVRQGGPGPSVFIPWREVLRLAGEHTREDEKPGGAASRRYLRRMAFLREHGYQPANESKDAPAGDTIEILNQVRGSRGHKAGIVIRASARLIEASVGKREWRRFPATKLLPGS